MFSSRHQLEELYRFTKKIKSIYPNNNNNNTFFYTFYITYLKFDIIHILFNNKKFYLESFSKNCILK